MNRFDYDFQEYQAQFNKVARKILSESFDESQSAQQVSDKLDEAQVTYQKIQKILNCPEMIKSHAYLYALDMENVDECDQKKIDKLYDLGVARGVIQDEPETAPEDQEDSEADSDDSDGDELCGGPDDALTGQEMVPGEMRPSMMSRAFTVLYSAMKDGQVKTGEFFSSATDQDAAKSDCISSLSPLGYANIRILGIEQANNAVDLQNSDLDTLDEDSQTDAEDEAQETGDTSAQSSQNDTETKTSDGTQEGEGGEGSGENGQNSENQKETSSQNSETTDNQESETTDNQESETDSTQDGESEEKPEENAEKSDETSSEGEPEQKKLTPTEKGVLKDEFVGMFKAELQATKLEKSPNDMNIKEKADFWNKILEKWKKQDPEEFMSPKEIEKLNNTVIKNS